jgi:uncharacterized membrane protein
MNERRVHQIFEISILLKGAHALIECVGGLVLTFVSTSAITSLVNTLTQEELIEDPNDFVAGHLLSLAQNFTVSTQRFYAFYLLSHGIIKVFLVVGLLRNKLWAKQNSTIILVHKNPTGYPLARLVTADLAVEMIKHECFCINRSG